MPVGCRIECQGSVGLFRFLRSPSSASSGPSEEWFLLVYSREHSETLWPLVALHTCITANERTNTLNSPAHLMTLDGNPRLRCSAAKTNSLRKDETLWNIVRGL